MKTLFFCPLWGMENLAYTEAAKRVKAAGYDGMEIAASTNQRKEAVQVTRDNGLDLILLARLPVIFPPSLTQTSQLRANGISMYL